MKKKILCVFALAFVVSLTACGIEGDVDMQKDSNYPSTIPSTTASTDETQTLATEVTPLIDSPLFTDYMAWLEDYAQKEKFLGVTNLSQSEVAGNPNAITYSCDYNERLVSLNISTEDEKVAYILSATSPCTFIDNGVFSDMSDAQMAAYSLALEPIVGINEKWNHSWHLQQFIDAPEQGSSASIKRTYTKDNWSFTVIMGNALVSISALDNSSSFDNSGNGNTSGSGNISNDGNNSSSSNTSNGSSTSNGGNSNNPASTESIAPAQTIPMNETPYTTSLSASIAIYSKPDSTSSFVQNVGQDGIYTIVEESYDSTGNLWGKLKSGLGWVLLKQSSTSSARTCPQCSQSEPDAFFDENWQEGDICVGCRYDNFHGGEEGKLYCSQCGADCTYRGLEEDGRCEDCCSGE